MNPPVGSVVEDPVRPYLDRIAAGLRGPRGRRARILAELRDGLDQAVAERTARGEPAGQAAATATAEFGSPEMVAAAFAGELATAYARRTLILFVVTGPLVGIWWLLLLRPDPWPAGLVALITAIPVIPLVLAGLATAASALATTGRLMRWLPESGPCRALAATITVACLALAGDLFVIGVAAHAGALTRRLAVIAVAVSLTRIGCSLRTLVRAGALRRGLPITRRATRRV